MKIKVKFDANMLSVSAASQRDDAEGDGVYDAPEGWTTSQRLKLVDGQLEIATDDDIPYAEKRRSEYPTVEEQLDMIYHEIAAQGAIGSTGAWFAARKAIKDKYPKPE